VKCPASVGHPNKVKSGDRIHLLEEVEQTKMSEDIRVDLMRNTQARKVRGINDNSAGDKAKSAKETVTKAWNSSGEDHDQEQPITDVEKSTF
jgi:hypothetical protein